MVLASNVGFPKPLTMSPVLKAHKNEGVTNMNFEDNFEILIYFPLISITLLGYEI
jgi:hypothetical protein